MSEDNKKSPEIEAFLQEMMPNRGTGLCATCGSAKTEPHHFKDSLSRKEFEISQMCQNCQDSVFDAEDLIDG